MNYLNSIQSVVESKVESVGTVAGSAAPSTALSTVDSKVDVLSTAVSTADSKIVTNSTAISVVDSKVASVGVAVTAATATPKALKTVTFSNTTGAVDLFTVTGFVKVMLYARCKTSVLSVGGCNGSLGVTDITDQFIAATDLTALAAGELWNDVSPTSKVERYYDAVFEYVLTNGQDIILTLSAQADSGAMEFTVEYVALSSDGAVVAAA
jgi:hypothetical protein